MTYAIYGAVPQVWIREWGEDWVRCGDLEVTRERSMRIHALLSVDAGNCDLLEGGDPDLELDWRLVREGSDTAATLRLVQVSPANACLGPLCEPGEWSAFRSWSPNINDPDLLP